MGFSLFSSLFTRMQRGRVKAMHVRPSESELLCWENLTSLCVLSAFALPQLQSLCLLFSSLAALPAAQVGPERSAC